MIDDWYDAADWKPSDPDGRGWSPAKILRQLIREASVYPEVGRDFTGEADADGRVWPEA